MKLKCSIQQIFMAKKSKTYLKNTINKKLDTILNKC
jgi:hypothetical protein